MAGVPGVGLDLGGLRGHQISFTIPPADRPTVSKWLGDVKQFFRTTASQAADVSKTFAIGAAPALGLKSGTGIIGVAGGAVGYGGVGGGGSAGGVAAPPVYGMEKNSLMMEDVLEGITVHYAVQLTSVLGHFLEPVRVEAARLLIALAGVFDKKGAVEWKKKLDRVTAGVAGLQATSIAPAPGGRDSSAGGSSSGSGTAAVIIEGAYASFTPIHDLFHIIGQALSPLAVALVAGLECFYTCPDWTVRGTCNSALARLVYENAKIFLEEDQLAAIWNLFFSLHSIPLISKVFPDRIVIIKALGLLAPLYVPADPALAYRIVESLLRLDKKTVMEREGIKSTLQKIFDKLSEQTTPSHAPVPQHGLTTGKENMENGFSVFVNLVNPNDEYAYDLLSWALETYMTSLIPAEAGSATKKVAKKVPTGGFPALTDFIKSLANHFRATPPLVRYGACVCLHAALAVYPSLIADNGELYIYIITGALDTDYLSAFLYVSMLNSATMTPAPTKPIAVKPGAAAPQDDQSILKTLLDSLRGQDRHKNVDYDAMYSNPSVGVSPSEVKLSDVLDVAIRACPPMSPKHLQKMANALEYLSKDMQLRQLEAIRLWGTKSEKFDTFLMQTLVPYCNSSDEDIQMAAIRVISSLIPSFQTASPADISFAWGYFHALMDHNIKATTLEAVLGLIDGFPLEKLATESREEFLNTLFELIFHPEHIVRFTVYDVIGRLSNFWKKSGLFNSAVGILILCIGDHNRTCAKKVLEHLFRLSDTDFRTIVTPLGAVKDALDESFPSLLKAFDSLAFAMARDRIEIKALIDATIADHNVDHFWDFFLGDVVDNQMVDPDDYNYGRNFIHGPFWIALLLTKLAVPPPSIAEGEPRNVMPSTPAGKRRYICGFMLCIIPTCGMPDPKLRRAGCVSAVRCCFREQALHPAMLRGLLELVGQQFMTHKQWTFQTSALDILRIVTRLKIPGVSSSMLIQYGDSTLDIAYNSPSAIVKIGALELLEIFLLVFPHGVANKLQEIRDVARALIVDDDQDVVKSASRIFPLVFRCTPEAQSHDFVENLKNELATIQKDMLEVAGDPMVANSTREEMDRVVRLSLVAMGAINDASVSVTIHQELIPYLRSNQISFRNAALSSILAQLPNLPASHSIIMIWVLLPMYADYSEAVRLTFSKYLRRIPSKLDALSKFLPPHPDDSLVLPVVSWEELLSDNASYTVSSKNINDILNDLEGLTTGSEVETLPIEDDGFRIPCISPKLMARIKELSRGIAGPVPAGSIGEVTYHLAQLQKHPRMQAHTLLVLSEFSCVHESTLNETIELFVNQLSRDITSENTAVIEACMLGLRNVAEFSPAAFKQILAKISSVPVVSEGDLIAMFYMTDLIQDVCAQRAPELLRKYIPIITSQRHPMRKRLYAVYLTVELALFAGQDEMVRTLDAIQILLDTTNEVETRRKVYGTLGKILAHGAPKHSLFRSLLNTAKKEIRSKDPTARMRTLDAIKILAKYMSSEEAVWFAFLYLADSNRDIRVKAREVLALEGMLDFVLAPLRSYKANPSARRSDVIETGKLLSLEKLGMDISARIVDKPSAMHIPLADEDPYNIQWYRSERRRKFTETYGMSEALFARSMLPLPQSIMQVVQEKSAAGRSPSPETVAKYTWLLNVDTIAILRECIKKHPQVAADLAESTLQRIEYDILPRDPTAPPTGEAAAHRGAPGFSESDESLGNKPGEDQDEMDIEAEVHNIDVLSNLLFAHDGIGDRVPGWVDRLRELVAACNNTASTIRENLYNDLENSFFFFNEYIDIPIVSDEQYNALESFKAATQEATMEIVKTGKTDKFTALERRKNELNDAVDAKSEQLRRLTLLALHGISGYGLFHALSMASSEARLITAFQFLSNLLENEHRGIRIATVEALVSMTMIQLEPPAPPKATYVNAIKTVITSFLPRLVDGTTELYRRKADLLTATAQLLPYIPGDRALRLDFIRVLVHLWRDPDGDVRTSAIKMVQMLGESGVAEITECFQNTETEPRPAAKDSGKGLKTPSSKPDSVTASKPTSPPHSFSLTGDTSAPNIMKQLAELINNLEYPEKDGLQELLKWRFALGQPTQAFTPPTGQRPTTTASSGAASSGALSGSGNASRATTGKPSKT
ncbi:armadillo-type protein [Fimicolochytrium jonesii]|uniref:armadillo-type protein n=1 Tax=Fimicolochytrium jonesii TaxID=1396493 RepID=UPI0022FE84A9|nr:armadillo-type protein [Fimicolochytrium jonesii]KAI8822501.1 armadillo-type protein [Fimicolochytrium jonesii]